MEIITSSTSSATLTRLQIDLANTIYIYIHTRNDISVHSCIFSGQNVMCPLCDDYQTHVKTANLRERSIFFQVKLGFQSSLTPIVMNQNISTSPFALRLLFHFLLRFILLRSASFRLPPFALLFTCPFQLALRMSSMPPDFAPLCLLIMTDLIRHFLFVLLSFYISVTSVFPLYNIHMLQIVFSL